MRIAYKLTLLAMLAVAATAIAAPLALGQGGEPELHNQTPRLIVAQEVHAANDITCPAVVPTPPPNPSPLVTAGGCRLHVTSGGTQVSLGTHLTAGGTEVEISSCQVEFDLRLDAAGEGWISHQELLGPSSVCVRQVCGQPTPPAGEGRAWTFYMQEREVAGQGPREEAVALFCTEPIGQTGPSHCEVTVPMSQTATHRYRFTASDASGHGAAFPHCELTGTFDVEAALGTTGESQAEQNVEIRHT